MVAPLDWGLGHATRCVPIIRALVGRGHQVFLAGEGATEALLRAEFPALPFLPLPGYRIRYGASALQTGLQLSAQLPRIVKTVKQENLWLQQQIKIHHFDAVISDNRYGLHHPEAYSVFITHQLRIKAPLAAAERAAQAWMYGHIKNFDCCWVPDAAAEPSLAGALSHPGKLPAVPVRYTGPLSRFDHKTDVAEKKGLLLLLSGPEPQRTILEKLLLGQTGSTTENIMLVRGLPEGASLPDVPGHVAVFNHLPAAPLQETLRSAALVVCRSGYSTVMDLAALQQRAVLVPTPGQWEQEYLAKHLSQRGFAPWLPQKGFDLGEAVLMASQYDYRFERINHTDALQMAINDLESAMVCGK